MNVQAQAEEEQQQEEEEEDRNKVKCIPPDEEMGFLLNLPPPCNVLTNPSTIGVSGRPKPSPYLLTFEKFLRGECFAKRINIQFLSGLSVDSTWGWLDPLPLTAFDISRRGFFAHLCGVDCASKCRRMEFLKKILEFLIKILPGDVIVSVKI